MSERTRIYGWAALEASFFWCLIYLFAVHYLVCVNWATYSDDQLYKIDHGSEHDIDAIGTFSSSIAPEQSVIEIFLKDTQNARDSSANHQIEAEAQKRLGECKSKLEGWDRDKSLASLLSFESILADHGKLIQHFSLGRHLRQPSLLALDAKVVHSIFEDTPRQLQDLIDEKEELNWAIIAALLGKENKIEKQKLSKADLEEMICSPRDTSGNADTEITETSDESSSLEDLEFSLYVNEDDLEVRQKELETILQERQNEDPMEDILKYKTVQSEMTESRRILKQNLTDVAARIDSEIKDFLSKQTGDDDASNSECVTQNEVLSLMEQGLDAVSRRQDLRAALLEAVKELDSSYDTIVLDDAVLGMDDASIPPRKDPTSINARRLVDTPLLRNLAKCFDQFLDLISGYNDRFDHYMDHLVETHVNSHDKDASSLGNIFVSQILFQSGQIIGELPVPSPIRKCFQRTEKGKALLASLS